MQETSFLTSISSIWNLWKGVAIQALSNSHRAELTILDFLISCQLYAFLVPMAGFFLAIRIVKQKRLRSIIILSDLLLLFAIGWILIAVFIWMAQFTTVIDEVLTNRS